MKRKRMSAEDADRYGFRWGPVDVTRVTGSERGIYIDVATEHKRLTVWVSNAGRRIRVYDEAGAELEQAKGGRRG